MYHNEINSNIVGYSVFSLNCAQSTNGCDGGYVDAALNYIQNYGSPPEATVPYTASYNVS